MRVKKSRKKYIPLIHLLKIKTLDKSILLEFYKILAPDIRFFRLLLFKLVRRIFELKRDIKIKNYRSNLYKRLNNYLDMNNQIFSRYLFVFKKLKIRKKDLNLVSDAYLEKMRSNIYYCWNLIRFFNSYDYPYSIFFRVRKRFNVYDKNLVVILEIILIAYDLNKIRIKIKKIMDNLSFKISNYLRERPFPVVLKEKKKKKKVEKVFIHLGNWQRWQLWKRDIDKHDCCIKRIKKKKIKFINFFILNFFFFYSFYMFVIM